jgi:hypothetical protein
LEKTNTQDKHTSNVFCTIVLKHWYHSRLHDSSIEAIGF